MHNTSDNKSFVGSKIWVLNFFSFIDLKFGMLHLPSRCRHHFVPCRYYQLILECSRPLHVIASRSKRTYTLLGDHIATSLHLHRQSLATINVWMEALE
jgi:hypothetical protein